MDAQVLGEIFNLEGVKLPSEYNLFDSSTIPKEIGLNGKHVPRKCQPLLSILKTAYKPPLSVNLNLQQMEAHCPVFPKKVFQS